MDSAHCFRLFRDFADRQPVQEEFAAGRRNTLIMAVGDDRVYLRDTLETYLHTASDCLGAAFCFRGAAMPRSLDWRDAKMARGRRLKLAFALHFVSTLQASAVRQDFSQSVLVAHT